MFCSPMHLDFISLPAHVVTDVSEDLPVSLVLWVELCLSALSLRLQLSGQSPLLLQQPQILLLPLQPLQISDYTFVKTLQDKTNPIINI